MAKPRFGIVALCDGVYKDEQTGKVVLAGIFTGNIVVAMPGIVHASIFVGIENPEDLEPKVEFDLRINGKTAGRAGLTLVSDGEQASIILGNIPLFFTEAGSFELRATFGGGRSISLLKKSVTLLASGPQKSANEPEETVMLTRTSGEYPTDPDGRRVKMLDGSVLFGSQKVARSKFEYVDPPAR